jgi:hypothetical protein
MIGTGGDAITTRNDDYSAYQIADYVLGEAPNPFQFPLRKSTGHATYTTDR